MSFSSILMATSAVATTAAASAASGLIEEGTMEYDIVTFGFILVAAGLWVGLYFFKHRHRKGDYFDKRKDFY